jgi:hypothetical protein
VTREQFAQTLGPELAARYGCIELDEIFLCRKRRPVAPASTPPPP